MLAQEEARRLGHNFVGTEQILLGLIGESTGIAAKVLKSMGVNLKDARIEVEKIIGRGSGFVAVEIPFTPRAKRVLELSLEEARHLGAPPPQAGSFMPCALAALRTSRAQAAEQRPPAAGAPWSHSTPGVSTWCSACLRLGGVCGVLPSWARGALSWQLAGVRCGMWHSGRACGTRHAAAGGTGVDVCACCLLVTSGDVRLGRWRATSSLGTLIHTAVLVKQAPGDGSLRGCTKKAYVGAERQPRVLRKQWYGPPSAVALLLGQ